MAAGTLRKVWSDEREAGFVLADGGFALAFKGGIEQGELPSGRGLDGDDAVMAAVEVEVFGFVADVLERSEAGVDVEVHVGEEAVLRDMETDGDGGGIAVAEVEVDVAHGGVEGAGVGIDDSVRGRDRAGNGRPRCIGQVPVPVTAARTSAGEEEHVADVVLITGCVVGKEKLRARCAVADDAHAGPDVDGAGDAVLPCRDEEDAFAVFLFDFVDGGLDGFAVVGDAVGVDREVVLREVDGGGVVELRRVVGLRCFESRRHSKQKTEQDEARE